MEPNRLLLRSPELLPEALQHLTGCFKKWASTPPHALRDTQLTRLDVAVQDLVVVALCQGAQHRAHVGGHLQPMHIGTAGQRKAPNQVLTCVWPCCWADL